VIQCESADAAELIVARSGPDLTLPVTDAALAGRGTGLELAQFAKRKFPGLNVILVSGQDGLTPPGRRPLFQETFCDRGIGAGRHGRRALAEVRGPAWGLWGLEGGAAQATHFIAAAGSTGSRSGRSPGIATALEKAFQCYLDKGQQVRFCL
jgi:hypothetical protein